MANTVIQLKHSTETGNVPSSLANGEISINSRDGKFFYSTPANVVVTHYPYPGPAGLNQEVQFNDSGVLGSDSGLTYNKTTDVLTVASGAIIGGVNVTPQIQLAFTQANSNFISAVTRLTVTNSGASAYLIDQYSGNNPSIYVSGGETLAFQLNNVTGHPFMIRVSSGGANYDTGLTHVSNTGTVLTGSSAQGQVTGTLYWKVPFDIVGSTYVYQCSIHGGMVGNIVIQQPASFVAANTTLAFNQANAAFSQANNESGVNDTQNNSITAAFTAANTAQDTATSAGVYANGAFAAANAATATDITQNNSITAAFVQANTPSYVANSASIYANAAFLQANTPSDVANSAAIYANGAFTAANTATFTNTTQNNSIAAAFTRANNSINANTGGIITGDLSVTGNLTVTGNTTYVNTTTVLIADNIITVNAAINQSSQPAVNAGIEVDRGAQPNSSFLWIETYGKWAANNGNDSIFIASDSVESYANSAFAAANAATATDTTQNNSITAAFLQANTPSYVANSAASYANSAFIHANAAFNAANTGGSSTDSFARNTANAAFARANNSLDANNGGTVTGTITATSFITTGSFGNIQGANTIYANNFVANTGFIQFADGSKQYTANAGSGGGGGSSFGQIIANVGTILATTSNDSLQIVGESGISVSSNVSAKKVIISVPAGFTFTTADYGFVNEDTNVIFDYGTL